MPDISSNDITKSTPQVMQLMPEFVKRKFMRLSCELINEYPIDCPAKRFLLKAHGQCPEESFVGFIVGGMVAMKNRLPVSTPLIRLLKDHDGDPVFAAICEQLKAEYETSPPSTSNQDAEATLKDYEQRFSRRKFLKGAVTAGFAAAITGELAKGGWENEDGSVNKTKAARTATEALGGFLTYESINKEMMVQQMNALIEALNPLIEKEMGLETHSLPAKSAQR